MTRGPLLETAAGIPALAAAILAVDRQGAELLAADPAEAERAILAVAADPAADLRQVTRAPTPLPPETQADLVHLEAVLQAEEDRRAEALLAVASHRFPPEIPATMAAITGLLVIMARTTARAHQGITVKTTTAASIARRRKTRKNQSARTDGF